MEHGHKLAKLKPANHQNFAIHQNFSPPKLPTIRYVHYITAINKVWAILLNAFQAV